MIWDLSPSGRYFAILDPDAKWQVWSVHSPQDDYTNIETGTMQDHSGSYQMLLQQI